MRISIDNVVLLEPATEARTEGHLVIEDGVIREVSSSPVTNAEIRIDGGGKTVIPGLIDCHVHVTAATADFPALRRWSPAYTTVRALDILSAMTRRGFTTVRDAGGADWGLAQAIQEGHAVGPRLRYCGQAISQTGGHGDMREPGDVVHDVCHCAAGLGRIADGVSAVRHACRDEIRRGATHIKIMASGGVSSTTDRIDSTQFSVEELCAAVEEAQAANIYVMAHAYTARAINRALESGIRSIEHGNYLEESSCELFKSNNAFLVPTLATYYALPREGLAAGLHASMVEKIGDTLDKGLQALELAHRSGVSIAYGTDLLGTMQKWQLHEFALRREVVGIGNALRSATSDAAELLCMEGSIGTLAPGACADLLVIDQDPLERPDTLENLQQHLGYVIIDGIQTNLQNTENAPIEEVELHYPIRIKRYELITDSCGAGRYRGGMAIRRDFEFPYAQCSWTVLSDGRKFAPWGLMGGAEGSCARFIFDPEGEHRDLPSKCTIEVPKGGCVRVETPGAGGFGDPRERDKNAVKRDLRDGKISIESAKTFYAIGE